MTTLKNQLSNNLVICLASLFLLNCSVFRPSKSDVILQQIILNNPAFRNELEGLDNTPKKKVKKYFLSILKANDEASLANENKLTKYFQDLFIDHFSNNDDYFFSSQQEKDCFKKLKVTAHYSYNRVIDIMSANKSANEINIFYDNLERLDNFLFLKSIEDSLKTDFFSYYYYFTKKLFLDDVNNDQTSKSIDGLNILNISGSNMATIVTSHPFIELSHRKLPLWFMLFHEFGHIYLNTSSEITADSFAYSHIKKLLEMDTTTNSFLKVSLLSGILDLIRYLYFEKSFLEAISSDIQTNKSELSKREMYYFNFVKNSVSLTSADSLAIQKIFFLKLDSAKGYPIHTPFTKLDPNIARSFAKIRQSKYFIPRNELIRRKEVLFLYENFTLVKSPYERDLLLLCLEKYYELKENDYNTAIVFLEHVNKYTSQPKIKEYCQREILRLHDHFQKE